MRSLLAFVVVMAPLAAAQGTDPYSPSAPSFQRLYERVSRSNYVIRGTVLAEKVIGRTPLISPEGGKPEDGGVVSVKFLSPRGSIFTVEINEVLCRQSDFDPRRAVSLELGRTILMFVPYREAGKPSDLIAGLAVPAERFKPGREYLLFLYKYPDQAALVSTNELDPSAVYYRAFDGYGGARQLPDASARGTPRDSVTPLLSAVTAFCEAVKPADVKSKIERLRTLRGSADPRWRDSVDVALSELELAERLPLSVQ